MLNTPHWQTAGTKSEPFVAGEKSRPLRLIVCDDELGSSASLDLLIRVAAHRTPLSFVSPNGSVGGTITVAGDEAEVDYAFKQGDGVRAFVYGDWWKTTGPKEAGRLGLDSETLRRRFLFVHEASQRDFIDGLVMPFDDRLRKRWRRPLANAHLMTVEEAVSLAGLYLRACGERLIEVDRPGTGIMVSEERMYLLGALAMLPEYGVLYEAAANTWRQTGDPILAGLTDAIAVRLDRALKARDYLQVRRRAPAIREIWSDVLYFFESVLVCLQGALDAAARLVHELFNSEGPRKQANWGRQRWWSRLEETDAPTSEFGRDRLHDLDVLVGDLRNSIHGEVLTGELRQTVQPGEKPSYMTYGQLAVVLDAVLAAPVSEAAERQGGPSRWAIEDTVPEGTALLDPWRYSEAAIVTTGEALSSIVTAVVAGCFSDTALNPAAQELWLGKDTHRENAALLFGLEKLPNP